MLTFTCFCEIFHKKKYAKVIARENCVINFEHLFLPAPLLLAHPTHLWKYATILAIHATLILEHQPVEHHHVIGIRIPPTHRAPHAHPSDSCSFCPVSLCIYPFVLSLLAGLDSRRFDSEGLLSSFIRELPDGTTQAGNKSSVASKLLLHTHIHTRVQMVKAKER